jgi:hypothetical protein
MNKFVYSGNSYTFHTKVDVTVDEYGVLVIKPTAPVVSSDTAHWPIPNLFSERPKKMGRPVGSKNKNKPSSNAYNVTKHGTARKTVGLVLSKVGDKAIFTTNSEGTIRDAAYFHKLKVKIKALTIYKNKPNQYSVEVVSLI